MGRLENSVFNSVFEMFLHVLMILYQDDARCFSLDEILLIDFISCYSADFGIGVSNLHSDNPLRYSEIAAKRRLIDKGIKKALYEGFVIFVPDKNYGFTYMLSESGFDLVSNLETSYSDIYQSNASQAIKLIDDRGINIVQKKFLDNARKGNKK